jgi:hypothetical protein
MGLGSLMRCETAVTGLPGGACARASTQDGSTRMGLGTRYRTTPPPLTYMLQCGGCSSLGRGHVELCVAVHTVVLTIAGGPRKRDPALNMDK